MHKASHDLHEPLRRGSTYLPIRHNHSHEEPKGFIDLTSGGVERIREMVNGLPTYPPVDPSGEAVDRVDCNAILQWIRDGVTVRMEETNAKITADPPPKVTRAPRQLAQLSRDLISTGIKYSGADTPREAGPLERQTDWEFASAENSIGLPLGEENVEHSNGDLLVESGPGKESPFYITLPVPG